MEAGDGLAGVLVRDTKDRGGLVLAYTPAAWETFTDGLKCGSTGTAASRRGTPE